MSSCSLTLGDATKQDAVSYGIYPSRPESVIFKDFNLKVPAGKTMALVGGSGSGKSTVIALLQRFYDPKGGDIFVDGVRIDKLQLKWLRSQMGLVSQEPALFATSIKENILFGKEDATMDEVIEAAKASNAHNLISVLPQAYDTQIDEGFLLRVAGALITKHPLIVPYLKKTEAERRHWLSSRSRRREQPLGGVNGHQRGVNGSLLRAGGMISSYHSPPAKTDKVKILA
ncbi:hypothetical protein LXL04_003735 [Taraxacum kok-saghyz]